MRRLVAILVLVATTAGSAAYYAMHVSADAKTGFRTVAVTRGDLLSTISATGTVEPEEVVDVGAQVAGLIVEFGPDPHDRSKLIDFGSVVEKDTVLAKIDATPYDAAFDQAEATLERSQADLLQLEAKCDQAKQEWNRAQTLHPSKAIAKTDYDTALANYKSAKASIAVGKATIRQNRAALRMAKTNLGYTTIKSPVRGVILARRVNIGQTVVASLNAPSLFLIAKDLRRMQVWASVNEADIGHIHVDMPVRFTVDAHADKLFFGKVTQIRMNATMTQNVVTYTVIVTTDNSNGTLLPYLTANVQFETNQRSSVLRVPNAVLRWKPQAAQIDPKATMPSSPAQEDDNHAVSSTKPSPDGSSESQANPEDRGRVWVLSDGNFVRPIDVTIGISDGTMTEIRGTGLKEGTFVVAGDEGESQDGEETKDNKESDTTRNPFLPPKPPKGARMPPPPM